MNRRLAPALVACTLLAAGLAAAPAHAATTHQVTVRDNDFIEPNLWIEPGDTVVWSVPWTTSGDHTVTENDGLFDFPGREQPDQWLKPGEQFSHTFDEPGVFKYYCRKHSSMTGRITVGDPGGGGDARPQVTVPDDYPTISDALIGVHAGTTVLIRPGVYEDAIKISTPDLVLRGLGQTPGDVVVDGGHSFEAVTVTAARVTLENLTIRDHRTSGVRAEAAADQGGDQTLRQRLDHGGDGLVLRDVVLDDNGYYGVDLQGRSGLTLRNVTATRHTIAGIAVRDCPQCGARLDGVTLERNGVGLLASDATGLIVRSSAIRGNGAGIVLRDTTAATITGNTLTGNAATDVRTASVFTTVPLWTGAGVWVSGGRAHHIRDNVLTGHTYNIAVTGPLPALQTQVRDNAVDDAIHADLGLDNTGTGVCLTNNARPDGTEPTSDPPAAQTLYDCALPSTVGLPYPVVTARLTAHAAAQSMPWRSLRGREALQFV